jgi:bacterioferritin-associated ferredoxin
MIVCVCKAVNDRAIRRAVAEGHDSFDALQFELGVGMCCGKCVAAACEVLCEARLAGDVRKPVTVHRRTADTRFESRETALA